MVDPRRQKLKIVLKIVAFKASCDGFPILNIRNSLPSLDSALDAIQFLLDLIESLIGLEKLKELLINMLSFELDKIESTIKTILKLLIKETFSCGISPTIPIQYITTGIDVDLKRIDFFDTLKVDPNSSVGTSTYGNPSTDFNLFLYNTVQQPTIPNAWKNLLIISYYNPNTPVIVDGTVKYNVINIKIHPSYINKPIFNFLNDFIDSIRFLPERTTVPKILDTLFGVLTASLNKDFKIIQEEVKFEKMVEKIISNGDNQEIEVDNSFFTFTNDELFEIEETATLRQSGKTLLKECSNTPSTISLSGVTELSTNLNNATNSTQVKNILTKSLSSLSSESSSDVSDEDKNLAEALFFKNLIKSFIKVIVKSIAGPAITTVLSIYFKLAYGVINYNSVIDFVKNNAKMYIDIIKEAVIKTVQRVLLSFLFNVLKELIICNFIENKKQTIKQYQDSLGSLVQSGKEKQLKLLKSLSNLGINL